MSNTHYDRTVDIVRHAIPRMSEHKIPITPSNYVVWYEYLTESNQELRKEMDALLGRDQPISQGELQDLYARYIEQRGERVQIAKTTLSQIVNALINQISEADGHYGSFSSELNGLAASLAGEVSVDELNALIERATRATNTVVERGAQLRQQFKELSTEMQNGRGELARSYQQARTDTLTEVNNRLAFQETLDGLTAGQSRTLPDDGRRRFLQTGQ